jgi:hypothetical protein
MFIKEVTLKRNGFAWKLYHFIFPWAPRYDNYCPFFWLTILAGVLFPFVFPFWCVYRVIKYIVFEIVDIFDSLGDLMERFVIKSLENSLYSLSNKDIVKFLTWEEKRWRRDIPLPVCEKKRFQKILKLYNRLMDKKGYNNDVQDVLKEKIKGEKFDIDQWLNDLAIKQIAYKRKQELDEQRRKEKIHKLDQTARNTANAIIPFAKVISIIFLIPIGIWLLWKICLGIGWCWYWIVYGFFAINWAVVFTILFVLAVLAATAGICWLLFILFRKIFSTISFSSIKAPSWLCIVGQWLLFYVLKPIGRFFKVCGTIFTVVFVDGLCKVGIGIGAFFMFFWNIFIAWKNKNCPAIIWKD